MQGRLKMEFPHDNCFPANHKADSRVICTTCVFGHIKSQKSQCLLFIVIPRARYHRNVC